MSGILHHNLSDAQLRLAQPADNNRGRTALQLLAGRDCIFPDVLADAGGVALTACCPCTRRGSRPVARRDCCHADDLARVDGRTLQLLDLRALRYWPGTSNVSYPVAQDMKSRLVAILCAAMAAIAAIILWHSTSSSAPTAAVTRQESRIKPASQEHAVSHRLAGLIASKALDSKHITAVGPLGFAIKRTGPLRPEGNALAFVHSLLPLSQAGDGTATFKIFLALLDCKRLYASIPAVADEDTSRGLAECESLLIDMPILETDWLSRSAEQGNIEAGIMYSLNPSYVLPGGSQQYLKDPEGVKRWREKSLSYLQQAVSLGSQDAMLSLSTAYGAGVFVDQDVVSQLAYALAAQGLSPIPGFDDAYRPLKSSLTPAQQQEAATRATSILDQCCRN